MAEFLPLVTFAVATAITPGPNNIMLTASGANFGFRRTLPHMLGVAIGFTIMVLAIGLGLSALFEHFPLIHQVLRYGGPAYLLYLAYRIATAAPTTPDAARIVSSISPVSLRSNRVSTRSDASPSTTRPALLQPQLPSGWR
ncbi:MAG TPA: LysE family translocator [Acidimicrobiales bacterium]